MFYDKAKIYVKAGDGGNGEVAFRREKYLPSGGPSGGDGGKGGDVIIITDPGLRTLVDFKYRQHYKASGGRRGQGKNRHGKSAEDLIIKVPPGTIVREASSGETLADMIGEGQEVTIARGGRGGRGNARFANARDRAPSFAENGEPGEEKWLLLELKLLADVGLIGMPNAGKSTLISRVSAARPRVAAYPFTTLTPNLGVVSREENGSFVIADIPGLIEGAHEGAGLGREFLRHIERSKVLVHVVDVAAAESQDFIKDFYTVNKELSLYDERLAAKPQIVAANKMDIPGAEENLETLRSELEDAYEIYPISAVTGRGIQDLLHRLDILLEELDIQYVMEKVPEDHYEEKTVVHPFTVTLQGSTYVVKGEDVEKLVAMTDLDNEQAVDRLQQKLVRMGVEDALRKKGVQEGDSVRIGDYEFYFTE